ncbi:restriction endonuclease subunit S [Candidatus Avelusimicrobium faecicola]|uniref:restriction endonuclease subunit S n=1 Tax=Candidatus Avelusimicrobium faecicola TaxID=3416205 RepID=UPI003D0B2246
MKNNIYINLSAIVNYRKGKMPLEFSEIEKQGFAPYIDIKLFDRGILSRFAKCDTKVTLVNKNDVLVVWDGARFGLSAIGWEGVLGSTIVALNSQYVLPKFLFYFIQSNFKKIQSKPRGVGIPHVEPSLFWNLPIPLPPLAEQKRIVKKIEELFGVIDEQVKRLEATHAALVSYRQSVLTDCLRKAAGVSTTLGKTVKPRRERVTFNGTNGNMIFIGMDCIESNALKPHKTDLLRNTKSTCFIFHKDDVLYGRMRSYLNKVFKAETNGAASAEFIVFPPTKDILPDYLKYLLHQQDFVSFATRNASGDRPRVKFEEDLAPFPFTLPSLPEQKAIVKKIENAFAFADKAQAAITGALEQAKQLKQSILKRAFEGKLVPQDPNDKPVDLTQIKKDKHK